MDNSNQHSNLNLMVAHGERKFMKSVLVSPNRLMLSVFASCLLLFTLGVSAVADDQDDDARPQSGRAYVMSNLGAGNTVIVFTRASDGTLTLIQEVATGGFGSGPGILPPPLPPFPG